MAFSRAVIGWTAAVAVAACPVICPLRGLMARTGDSQAAAMAPPVCPCCPRPARDHGAPKSPDQRPGDNCICQGAVVGLDRAVDYTAAEHLLGMIAWNAAIASDRIAAIADRNGSAVDHDIGPLSGRDRCLLRSLLRC